MLVKLLAAVCITCVNFKVTATKLSSTQQLSTIDNQSVQVGKLDAKSPDQVVFDHDLARTAVNHLPGPFQETPIWMKCAPSQSHVAGRACT